MWMICTHKRGSKPFIVELVDQDKIMYTNTGKKKFHMLCGFLIARSLYYYRNNTMILSSTNDCRHKYYKMLYKS